MKKINNIIKFFIYKLQYISFNKKLFSRHNFKNNNKILVEFYLYNPSIISYALFANVLSKHFNASIYTYTTKINNPIKNLINIISNFLYWKVYQSFGCKKIIFPNNNYYERSYFEILKKKIRTKNDIINIKIKKIPIGDLIYDEYIRRHNIGTIDIEDPKFFDFLKESVSTFFFWEAKLDKSVKSLLISHSVYFLGLPARIAIYKNIPVYNISMAYVYYLSKKNILRCSGFENYPKIFKKIKNKFNKNILQQAKKKVLNKFLGKFDLTQVGSTIDFRDINKIFHNKSNKQKLFFDKNKTNILIASHCFTDAVHAHGDSIFLDFQEWIEFLIDYSKNKPHYKWYVKMHPAEFERNKNILKKILPENDKFVLLPKNTSHNQIISSKIDVVLSVYGSVGYEYPFVNIPVINASYNGPHQGYDFNYHAKSKKNYKELLNKIPIIKRKRINKNNKLKISEYYFIRFMTNYQFLNNFDKVLLKLKENYKTSMIYREFINKFNYYEFENNNNNLTNFVISKKNRIYSDNTKKVSKPILFY